MSSGPAMLAVLMVMRVRGRATLDEIAIATGADPAVIAPLIEDAHRHGFVESRREGHVVTAEGRREVAECVSTEPLDRSALQAVFEKFLMLDDAIKAAVTAYQQASPASSPGPDARVRTLVPHVVRAVALANELGAISVRFSAYASRLNRASAALDAGDRRFVASPIVDSLHQVWFELHEDLLVTLGRERTT